MKRLLLLMFFIATLAFGQNAKEIVQKSIDVLYGKKTYALITMTIVKPAWTRSVSMKSWSFEPDYSLAYITEPARDKGTVTLKRKNEVWNWLPNVQKSIKIPPSMMLASWMGSDYTNDDLVRQSSVVDDYIHKLIAEEKFSNFDCYKILLTPKPEAGVVWGKLILWITKKEYMQMKVEYYDEDGLLTRTMIGSKPKVYSNHLLPSYWEMIPNNKPGNKTIFDYKELDFNVKITPEFFSIQNMSRVR